MSVREIGCAAPKIYLTALSNDVVGYHIVMGLFTLQVGQLIRSHGHINQEVVVIVEFLRQLTQRHIE